MLGTSGQLHTEVEAKDGVSELDEIKHTSDLLFDLIRTAEDMGIILNETTNTSKTMESTRKLITVENTKLCKTKRKLTITACTVLEHQAVAGAVHGFKSPHAIGIIIASNLEGEHVLLVVLPVAADLPKLAHVDVGGHNFIITTTKILLAHEIAKLLVHTVTARKEEARSRTVRVEEEKLLFLAKLTVVTTTGLLKHSFPFLKLSLVGESKTMDTLKDITVCLSVQIDAGR